MDRSCPGLDLRTARPDACTCCMGVAGESHLPISICNACAAGMKAAFRLAGTLVLRQPDGHMLIVPGLEVRCTESYQQVVKYQLNELHMQTIITSSKQSGKQLGKQAGSAYLALI